MMTKMAVRLASLAAMDIRNRSVLWDVGACTGSISIEAKLMNPLLDVHSFEVREERVQPLLPPTPASLAHRLPTMVAILEVQISAQFQNPMRCS